MKRIYLLLMLICWAGNATAQEQEAAPEESRPIEYSGVVQVEGVSAADLFTRARAWFAITYDSAKAVLQMSENNRLIGKAKFTYPIKDFYIHNGLIFIEYTIDVECRDGRYKWGIYNTDMTFRYTDATYIDGTPDYSPYLFGQLTTAETTTVPKHSPLVYIPKKGVKQLWDTAKISFNTYVQITYKSLQSFMTEPSTDTDNDW